MYREQIRVLDCTIRDGGLVNKHQFSFDFVREVYQALAAAGVDYMEIGYKNSRDMFSKDEYGPWKFCDDADILQITDGIQTKMKISVMADVGRVDMSSIKPAHESPVDMVRTACYVKGVDKAIAMANEFSELGYETCINIMALSRDRGPDLDEAIRQIESESKCQAAYIVDSFGNLYQEEIEELAKRFKANLKTKEIGIHCHNNQQLAFSNTIEGIIHGVNYLDSTIYGMGRAAGNCTTELLLGFLKNPKFDVRPVLDVISKLFIPLREQYEWGYIIPHAIAGMLNEHPNEALALRESPEKDNYRAFYDSISAPGI
jgi:4-hydroxy 2-oxovalerate aldolase